VDPGWVPCVPTQRPVAVPPADVIGSLPRTPAEGTQCAQDGSDVMNPDKATIGSSQNKLPVARMSPPTAALGQPDGVSQGTAVPRMGRSALLMSAPASVVTRLRPPSFLAYINPSARSKRSSPVSVGAAIVAPTEMVTRTWTWPLWIQEFSASMRIRSAAARRPAWSVPGMRARNSSPPHRTGTSPCRSPLTIDWPTVRSTSSPVLCPNVSLTSLKWSAST
jgi:hypothetical protein